MTADAPAGARITATELIPLDDGWTAIGVPPGSADHLLTGLEGSMLPLTVPGTAAAALRESGLWRPGSDRRLDAEDWWFRCRFELSSSEHDTETVLRLGGIATVAEVWLNGVHVLSSRNMHVGHELPADALEPGENEVVIGVAALEPLLAQRRPRPRWRTRLVESQNLRWFRTTMIGRLPSFAPEPAPVGPWRGAHLECRRLIAADQLDVRASVEGTDGIVRVHASFRGLGGFEPQTLTLRVNGPTGAFEAPLERASERGSIVAQGFLRIPDVDLWWPHTHGTPARHTVEVVAAAGESSVVISAGSIGFRALEATSEPGLALAVNGVPVFCRGGSLLPDAVTLDHSPEELRALLVRARDAGLNMIRLSGVGTYGSDAFYELCDELGLLVWQDFPFANLDYPIEDEEFRASVDLEARQFLARAGCRPSLAVLCGNSEIEQQVGMLGLDGELGRGGPLFAEILPALVAEYEVDAHYLPSTPSGGDMPFSPNAGIAHYFGVGAYRRPLEDARRAEVRFASECLALANVPDDDAIEALAPGGAGTARLVHHPTWKAGVPRDVGTGWDFDDVRDHYLRELYDVDPVDLRSADPDRYLALSRVVSGEVMAATLGEWRRARSTCSGALVWTLNDPVPGAGWGILDVHGRPKAAYWYVRRALAPVAVWMTDEGTNGVAVHVANDTASSLPAQLTVALHRPDGRATGAAAVELELGPHTVIERSVESILGWFADAGYAFRFGPPEHDVVVATLHAGSELLSQAFHFPLGRPNRMLSVEDLGVDAVLTRLDERTFTLGLRSQRLAYAVSLEVPGCVPQDNFVTIAPDSERVIVLHGTCDEDPRGTVKPLNANGHSAVRSGGDA